MFLLWINPVISPFRSWKKTMSKIRCNLS